MRLPAFAREALWPLPQWRWLTLRIVSFSYAKGPYSTKRGAIAVGIFRAYTLSDRGTWLSFANKAELKVLVEGDPGLLNRYDVILLDPKKHPDAKHAVAQKLRDWRASGDRRIFQARAKAVQPVGGGTKIKASRPTSGDWKRAT